MSDVYSANVTKYNAGGSGDNIVADGYIKTVEKVWIDSYNLASHTSTKVTLDIAVLSANKKLTGIEVQIETTVSQTSGALALGFSTDAAYGSIMAQTDVAHNLTVTTLKLPGAALGLGAVAAAYGGFSKVGAFQKVLAGTQTTVTLQLNNWTMTNGTIKTIVRYT